MPAPPHDLLDYGLGINRVRRFCVRVLFAHRPSHARLTYAMSDQSGALTDMQWLHHCDCDHRPHRTVQNTCVYRFRYIPPGHLMHDCFIYSAFMFA